MPQASQMGAGESRLWRLIRVAPMLAVLVLCLPICGFLSMGPMTQWMARRLAPEPYPGSLLTDEWLGGGPTTQWFRRTYQAEAPLTEVVGYMEARMPGFQLVDSQLSEVGAHQNYVCDRSRLARWLASAMNEGHYPWYTADSVPLPCVSVTIYSATDSSLVEYQIWIDWPAW